MDETLEVAIKHKHPECAKLVRRAIDPTADDGMMLLPSCITDELITIGADSAPSSLPSSHQYDYGAAVGAASAPGGRGRSGRGGAGRGSGRVYNLS